MTDTNPFPNVKFKTFLNGKNMQMTISDLIKMAESSRNLQKTLWKKEKLLFTGNFSFSHSVFKRLVKQTRIKQGLFGKGLNKPASTPLAQVLVTSPCLHVVRFGMTT